MNLAILVGVIASEIKRTDFKGSGSVTRFRVKTTHQYSLDGETKESSQTHLVNVYNNYLQDKVVPFLKEGQMIGVQGSIESQNFARQGEPANWNTVIAIRASGLINSYSGSNASVVEHARPDEKPRVDHSPKKPTPLPDADDGFSDEVPF